uniref:Sleeping Beauty transposase HTH domain-containing protein n=1 Tax=Oncorhynchus tshawytscha TaxID=74940 RepID=A0AAZ3RC25_ONCTS
MSSKELSVELQDRIVSRHRSGEGFRKMSAAFKVPKNILKWKKFGTTKTLPRAVRPAKPNNRGRRALVNEVTKNPMVNSDRAPKDLWRWENLPEGQPSLQQFTNQTLKVEWPDGSHSSVEGT